MAKSYRKWLPTHHPPSFLSSRKWPFIIYKFLITLIKDLNLLIISSVFAESIARIWYIVDDKKKGEGLNFLVKLWSTKTQTITIRNRIKEFSFWKKLLKVSFEKMFMGKQAEDLVIKRMYVITNNVFST